MQNKNDEQPVIEHCPMSNNMIYGKLFGVDSNNSNRCRPLWTYVTKKRKKNN